VDLRELELELAEVPPVDPGELELELGDPVGQRPTVDPYPPETPTRLASCRYGG